MIPIIETRDRTSLFYKDWGNGKPVVFVHGWALGADMWEYQTPYLGSRGLRCVAYDKRGCGRSSQPWLGYDFETFADDLADERQKVSRCCGGYGPDEGGHLRRRHQLSHEVSGSACQAEEWQKTLGQVFTKVDFIALPTLQNAAIPVPKILKAGILEARMLGLQNTVPVNFAGNPALAMPVPLRYVNFGRSPALAMPMPLYYETVPVTSLQLIGPPHSEPQLLNAGRLVENAVRPWVSVKIPMLGVSIQ